MLTPHSSARPAGRAAAACAAARAAARAAGHVGRRDTSVLADAVGALAVVGAAVAAGGAAFGVLRVVQPGGVGSGDSQGRGDQKCQKRSPFLNKHGT